MERKILRVALHLGLRRFGLNHRVAPLRVHAQNAAPLAVQVADDVAGVRLRHGGVEL